MTKKRRRDSARSPRLTDAQWRRVFELRCASKRGEVALRSEEDLALVTAAFEEDRERYAAMEVDIFNATVPFGSSARRSKS